MNWPRSEPQSAFARIAMGYPLFIAAVGFSFLGVTRARHRLTAAR